MKLLNKLKDNVYENKVVVNCLPNWCPPSGECMPDNVCAPDHWCPPYDECHPDCCPAEPCPTKSRENIYERIFA